MSVNIEKIIKDTKKDRKVLYEQLKRTIPGLDDEYDINKLARRFNRNKRTMGIVLFEQCTICFVIKKMETEDEYARILQQSFGIGKRQGNNLARTFQLAIDHEITADQINTAGSSKFLLLAGAPQKYIDEFKKSTTIEGKEFAGIPRDRLKEIIEEAIEAREAAEAENEKVVYDKIKAEINVDELFEKNRKQEKKIKELQQRLDYEERGLSEFPQKAALNNALVSIELANYEFKKQPIENDFTKTLAEAVLGKIEDEIHRLLHHIRKLAHPEPYDQNNQDVKRVMDDPRFDWDKLDNDEAEDENQPD